MEHTSGYRRMIVCCTAFATFLVFYFWVWSSSWLRGPGYHQDYTVIQKGMTEQRVRDILVTAKGMTYIGMYWRGRTLWEVFDEPDSAFMPGCEIVVHLDSKGCADLVEVNKPSTSEIWKHWKLQLGL